MPGSRSPQWWSRYVADVIEPRIFAVRQLPRAGVGLVVGVAALNIAIGVLGVAFLVSVSVVIGSVPGVVEHGPDSPQWDHLVRAFLFASATFICRQLLAPVVTSLGQLVRHRVDGRFRDRLLAASLRSAGIAPLEDQEALGSLHLATEQLDRGALTPGDAVRGTLAYLARYTELAGCVILLGVVASWPAAFAILGATMCFRYGHRGGLRSYVRVWPVLGPVRREAEYFRGVGLGVPAAKEVRLFGLIDWVVARYRARALAALSPLWAARRRAQVHHFLWFTAIGVLVAATVLALLVRSAAQGEIGLADLVLGMQAAVAALVLGDYYHEADTAAEFGLVAARAVDDFDSRAAVLADRDVSRDGIEDARGLPRESVRLDRVSFTYPGARRAVLDDLSLTLRAGECTAIVGLNGAGKTTLVKLLTRLYEPTSGAVLVDGRDLRELSVDAWRRQIGVIFQDFVRYELSAQDNITFGAVERPLDPAAVASAAARSGIATTIERLPHGMDTLLARQYDDGAELSGGQWQRLAIARALYAVQAGAQVLVLDEPTAALDVRAEAAFFDRFVELTQGLTTVLISHRFSSVRHADRIVVLEHGRIVEDGTPEQLVSSGGRYAELFRLQSERFTDGSDAGSDPDLEELA